MRDWLLRRTLRLPAFPGRHRIVKAMKEILASPFVCKMKEGLLLEIDCFEWAQDDLVAKGCTEPQTMQLITRLLRPGDAFVDVGAHIGFVTLVARKAVGDRGIVIAIEPQPYNCERILGNWELNGFNNLRLHIAAAGPDLGFVTLSQQSKTDKTRLSLAVEMHDALPLEYEVPMVTLDAIITKHSIPSVRLLKIDVEGFETSVLRGLSQKQQVVENIVFEALSATPRDVQATQEACKILTQYGFKICTLQGEPWSGELSVLEGNLWATREVSPTN